MNKIFKDTKSFTFMCAMLALTIFFTYTLGMLPTSFASLAILIFVPTIITSITHGPVLGALMGALTGIVTLTRAMTMPTSPLDPFFMNPLISVLPRTFVGIFPYYIYTAVTKLIKNSSSNFLGGLAGGFIGSITNTAFVMGMLYIVYAKDIIAKLGVPFKALLISIVTSSGVIEAVLTSIFTAVIIAAFYKRKNSRTITEA